MLVNLPNIITGIRVLLAPVIVICFTNQCYKISFWALLIAGLTDWLDGFCARFFKQETSFGKSFDPIADKILVVLVYWTLAIFSWLPWWLTIVVISRDVLITIGVAIANIKHINLPIIPIFISKINTFIQIFLSLLIMYGAAYMGNKGQNYMDVVFITSCIIFVTTVWSGITYAKIFCYYISKQGTI